MTKFLSNSNFHLEIKKTSALFLIGAALLAGCSVYRSDGRKNLEEQARTLSSKEFLTEWQCEPHSLEGIVKDQYWIEGDQLHWLGPTQLCVHSRLSTGSNPSN